MPPPAQKKLKLEQRRSWFGSLEETLESMREELINEISKNTVAIHDLDEYIKVYMEADKERAKVAGKEWNESAAMERTSVSLIDMSAPPLARSIRGNRYEKKEEKVAAAAAAAAAPLEKEDNGLGTIAAALITAGAVGCSTYFNFKFMPIIIRIASRIAETILIQGAAFSLETIFATLSSLVVVAGSAPCLFGTLLFCFVLSICFIRTRYSAGIASQTGKVKSTFATATEQPTTAEQEETVQGWVDALHEICKKFSKEDIVTFITGMKLDSIQQLDDDLQNKSKAEVLDLASKGVYGPNTYNIWLELYPHLQTFQGDIRTLFASGMTGTKGISKKFRKKKTKGKGKKTKGKGKTRGKGKGKGKRKSRGKKSRMRR